MDNSEGKDTYVSQLKDVFESCDTTGSHCLNETELMMLCTKLHLLEHSNFLIFNLIRKKGLEEVKFEDFKNCFVALLSQAESQTENMSEEDNDNSVFCDENGDREISPKFTFGRKKYGRRSRPASIADDTTDVSTLSTVSPLNSLENSVALPSTSKYSKKADSGSCGKRPSSPTYTQQPPSKSGRLTRSKPSCNRNFINQPDESNLSLQQAEETSSSFESSPVEYLQQTWKKLGIGSDGYLTVEELALVCEHIGMDMTEEVIAQLFEKLDCDQDGRISFEEFLQGLFQHGEEPQSCESSKSQISSRATVFKETPRDDSSILSTMSLSGIFSCLDSDRTGYADVTIILELWESLELPCSPRLLEELGFNIHQKINLCELTSILEEELINSAATTPLGQLAFVSYQNELNYLRQTVEQILTERNRLHGNIEEANARAALLAQEVDDNHAKLESALQSKLQLMEKKYQDQIRDLVEELQQERDSLTTQCNKVKQQLQGEIQTLRDEEVHLKNRLNILEQENSRLEFELQETTEKYLESEKQNEALQRELSLLPELKERLAELESNQDEIQETHHKALLLENENYKRHNQQLQDKIDELTLEIENLHQNPIGDHAIESVVTRTHSWLSDYKKTAFNGFKRRGSESLSDENSDEESPTEKIRRTFFVPESENSFEIGTPKEVEEINDLPMEKKEAKTYQPSEADIMIRDLYVERENLIKKLHLVEEKNDSVQYMNKNLKHKSKVLNRLAYDIARMIS